nr:MAG TPA: hypothetical protein [Caudoviricetes sp.]
MPVTSLFISSSVCLLYRVHYNSHTYSFTYIPLSSVNMAFNK